MSKFLKKLIIGSPTGDHGTSANAFGRAIENIRSIWNNKNHQDVGIERLFRLFLSITHLLFPGIYLRQIFGKRHIVAQEIAVDIFVLLKLIYPLTLLYFGLTENLVLRLIVIWFMLETLMYIPMLIFASDLLPRPRSYRRSMLLLFFNYLEVVMDFAVIYASGHYLNETFATWYDPIYFSFSTFSTVGFGDYYPTTAIGKLLFSCQTIIFFLFIVLFINTFSTKMEQRGYFGHKSEEN